MSARKRLSLEQKVKLIELYDREKPSVRSLAEKMGIGKTQVADTLKKRENILKLWTENKNKKSKKLLMPGKTLDVDACVLEWFVRARTNKIPVNGPLIQEKAREVAKRLDLPTFKASNGWLEKFRARNNITYRSICGESGSVPEEGVIDWTANLEGLISKHNERDIFNCDETGLFYRALPDKTMTLKGETCAGGKISKERLTVLLCVNMIGEFLPPLIIGKAKKPRCFRGVRTNEIGTDWRYNSKAWMTREIFTQWLTELDEKMGKQKRKILLFLDNASSHYKTENLSNVQLIFFPPNTTSRCQPLDQGIIKNFKVLYRAKILRHLLSKIDKETTVYDLNKSISVLDAIFWTVAAVKEIKPTTVINCFVKAGFKKNINIPSPSQENETDVTEEFTEFVEGIAEDYFDIDDSLFTDDQGVDIQQIVKSMIKHDDGDEEEEEGDGDANTQELQPIHVTLPQALENAEKIKHFFLNCEDPVGVKMAADIQMLISTKFTKINQRQTTIEHFFKVVS